MKTLVTGSTGHIGFNLVRLLIEREAGVKVLVRPSARREILDGLDVELVYGDVLDRQSLRESLKGCDRLYHLATPPASDPEVMRIATEGTRNVFELMTEVASVERAVYTSSTVTIGYASSPSGLLDENTCQRLTGTPYQIAKWEAEAWLRSYLEKTSLPVVIVNPGTVMGAGDYRVSPPNRVVVDFINRGGSPIYFDGGLTIADVEDVAAGHMLAMERGKPGERYILGGDRVTVKEIFQALARVTGFQGPWLRLPKLAMFAAAGILQCGSRLGGKRQPLLTIKLARTFVGAYSYHSSAKAVSELGYKWRSCTETIERAVKWFLCTPFVSDRRKHRLQRWIAERASL